MKRRDFMKMVAMLGVSAGMPMLSRPLYAATPSPYTGTIFFNIHAHGGLDQSSFADPREDPAINSWAKTASTGGAGNIRYAPMPGNEAFFQKYHQHMLVINGVDSEVNNHSPGTRSRWSGRVAIGYPNIGELIAGVLGQGLPMSYIYDGGYGDNVGVMPYTRLPDPTLLQELSAPNRVSSNRDWMKQGDLDKVQLYKRARVEALKTTANLQDLSRALSEMDSAYQGEDLLDRLAASMPTAIDTKDLTGADNKFVQKIHRALIPAHAGLTSCINLQTTANFDSHENHDERHQALLPQLTAGIDYLWEKATELGLANRLVVFMTSEFGRTPHYNAGLGKDHWPYGSAIFMKKGAPWGDRVVGASDEQHKALKINPYTLQVDNSEQGIILKSKHVMQAYRMLAGIDLHPHATAYPLYAEEVDFFNPQQQTGYPTA